MAAFPEELVQQFRQIAIERLDRIEESWGAVIAKLDEEAATIVHRELHTLKGESRMLGFSDVNLVCHKLEDMLEVARMRGYAIDEDFDLAVNMAIRFMAMLVRKKVGSQLVGIDLPGFIKQIDGILAELRPEPTRAVRTTTGAMQPLKAQAGVRVPSTLRTRLGPIAVDTFIEYTMARGLRRDRLRTSWHGLRDMIGIQRAVLGPNQLSKHKAGAQSLAKELGKQVEIQFDIETVEATTEILAAVDTAVLHLVRNGIDHGIESAGTIRVHAVQDGATFVLTVADDGRGIAMDDVRRRAVERGLIPADERDLEDHWVELVCQPGFTTKSEASEVSGRGVGLDVVRVGIHEVGGQLTATTVPGKGTTWRIKVPLPRVTIPVWMFRIPGAPFAVTLDSAWSLEPGTLDVPPLDLAHRLGLVDEPALGNVRYFRRDSEMFGIAVDRTPQAVEVRRLVAAPAPALGDVIVTDASEGLLIFPDRFR